MALRPGWHPTPIEQPAKCVDAEAAKFHRELAENFKARLEKAQAQPTKRVSLV